MELFLENHGQYIKKFVIKLIYIQSCTFRHLTKKLNIEEYVWKDIPPHFFLRDFVIFTSLFTFSQLFICFTKCRHTLMPPSGNKLYIWIFEDFSFSKNCVLSGHVETSTGRSMGIMKCFCHLTSMLLNFWFNFSFDNLFPCIAPEI